MINEKDSKIIKALREDARMGLTQMSRKTGVPVSTIFDKMRKFEDEIILKHTTLVDFKKLGFGVRAMITMKVGMESKEAAKEYLMKHSAINSVFRINNGYDFLAEVLFREMDELEGFLELLELKFDINQAEVYYVLDDLKREVLVKGF